VVVDANVALEYNLLRHLGLGIGHTLFHGNIKTDDDLILGISLSGDYTITFQGLRIYGKLYCWMERRSESDLYSGEAGEDLSEESVWIDARCRLIRD
jgi:hypothetical protein